MLYLNKRHLIQVNASWKEAIKVISECTELINSKDFAQPLKPYLRYGNLTNRIIAMPSYIGGNFASAGIKWISSFPENLDRDVPRAHSVTILNEAETGKPVSIINTNYISGIRTAAVSGFVIDKFDEAKKMLSYQIGIVGFGPVGKLHLEMIIQLLGESKISSVVLYDIRPINEEHIPKSIRSKVIITNSWEEAFETTDIFVTATVAHNAYIDKKPKPGSLHLNVSLRDYKTSFLGYVDKVIVDNWEEVCRENTDIEHMHIEKGLEKEDTYQITDILSTGNFFNLKSEEVVMFNPMGMAVYDIAIGSFFYKKALEKNIGLNLEA